MALIDRPAVGPAATAFARSPLPPAVLQPLIAELPLTEFLTGSRVFPAVTGVEGQEGRWDRVGGRRLVRLADGGSVVETLVELAPGSSFAYELTGFTDVFDRFVHGVRGEWSFAPDGDGCLARWTWEFAPKPGRRLVMAAVLGPLWQRYAARILRSAVDRVSAQSRWANAEA